MSVETIRDIPVIVEHRKGCSSDGYEEPMDFDHTYYTTGFPFDSSGRRDPLEDIAQRHPELAQHLQGFPRRSQRSNQDEDEYLRRRFERPFSSGRFERFGFPFDRDDFEREPQRYYEAYPEYFESFQNQQPTQQQHGSTQTQQGGGYQQHPPQYSQQYQPHPQDSQNSSSPPQYRQSQSVSQATQTDECEPQEQEEVAGSQEQKTESGQTRGRPIQQSNTCDLSQHQPPDEEALNDREQRSMSAPPENKRFTSSVNIPMGTGQQQQEGAKSQAPNSGSTERVIPIHVEGRDDPVIPKNFSSASSQHHQQPQAERIFSDSPRPQPETIFGRRPEAFTQFVHREPHRFSNDWPHSFGSFPEDDFSNFRRSDSPTRFAGAKPQPHPHQQQSAPKPQPHPQQQQSPSKPQPQQQQEEPAQQASKPQQPPKQPLGPIEQIQVIQKDVSSLLRQVEAFKGAPKDKNYLYLDEMLTRNLLKLDNVDTQGQDSIRSARKEAIKCIERAISLLESIAAANVAPKEEKMEVEQPEVEKMEAEPTNMEMSPPAADQSGEASNKSVEEQPKSGETVENAEGEAKAAEEVNTEAEGVENETKDEAKNETEEIKSEEPAAEETAANVETKEESKESETVKDGGEVKTQAKEGEKKEKKKIKKKVNKEDKEKKQ